MSTLDARQLAALEQAAQWYSRLGGEPGPDDRQAWQDWLQAAEENRWAWQQAERLQHSLQRVPSRLAGRALDLAGQERQANRRSVLKGLLLLAGTGTLGWGGYRHGHEQGWLADRRTAVGQRLDLRLADGSRLQLNTDSAVDLRYDRHQRLLLLRRGEILLSSGHDPSGRPLRVATPQGLVEALGTRFSLRLDGERSRVAVHQQRVRVTPRDGTPLLLESGQSCSFGSRAVGALQPLAPGEDAWVRGLLVANDQPLGQFLAELGRHRPGWLRCDPAVAGLRISGTFALDDTDQALRALAGSLPLRIEQRSRYWVSVLPR